MAWFTAPTFVDGNVLTASDLNTLGSNAANGTVTVAHGGTGLTVGTSGGVPYFSSTTAMGSSGALTQYGVVYGGGAGAGPSATAAGAANTVLHGAAGAPSFSAVVEADLTLSDNTTNDASTSKHGFLKKLPNDATKVLDGVGSFTALTAGTVTRTSGDVTTASGTLTDLTGASITLSTGARRVLLTFSCHTSNNTAPSANTFNFDVDGAAQLGSVGYTVNIATTNAEQQIVSMSFLTAAQTAASHTFKVRWRVSAGTGTVCGSASSSYHFSAMEVWAA